MKNIPSNIYLQHALVLTALKWFGDSNACGRNCLAAIKATNGQAA